jgi:kinesin family member 16B
VRLFDISFSEQRDEIEKYETELIAKDNLLEECHRKIEEMDGKLKQLEAENRMLLTQKSQEELERLQMKKQSLTLSLKNTTLSTDVETDTNGLAEGAKTTGTETCDTFHTAHSDCSFASALPSPFPPKENSHQTPESEAEVPNEILEDGKELMSDSGVCLDTKIHEPPLPPPSTSAAAVSAHPLAKHCFDGDNLSTTSSQHFYEQLLQSQMEKLRMEIAGKKAEIMKILEMGGEKAALDEMINELQELQKDYVKMEMRLENSRGKSISIATSSFAIINMMRNTLFVTDGCVSDGEMSTELRGVTGSTSDSDESRHNPLTMSTMSTRNNSLTASLFAHHIMTRSLPSIEGSFQSQTIREYKENFPTMGLINEKCSFSTEPEHSINIPSYIMRGAGKQTHVEYEIRIFLSDDRWLLLRRFSRFRELHLSMKELYGDKVSNQKIHL